MAGNANPNSIGGTPRMSLIVFVASVVAFFGSSWYVGYREEKQRETQLPHLALQSVMGDLRRFHQKVGRFPETLEELRDRVAGGKQGPSLEDGGRTFVARNYYYRYALVSPHAATVWAVPVGPRREEGSTNFLIVVGDGGYTHYKGPALTAEQARSISADPSTAELAALGLTKQTRDQPAARGGDRRASAEVPPPRVKR